MFYGNRVATLYLNTNDRSSSELLSFNILSSSGKIHEVIAFDVSVSADPPA